jgi:hypothetical protein
MIVRPSVVAALALAGVVATAFFIGRRLEERAIAANLAEIKVAAPAAPTPATAATLDPPSYQELRALDVLALPFADFYEALRNAPNAARSKWAGEVEHMPAGPRRTAAVMGFYKLLIQFDPAVAMKSIREIQDKRVRNLALEAAVDAVPGFAIPDLAEVMSVLYEEPTGHTRNYSYELIQQWTDLDPAAVARFEEQHRRVNESHPVSTEVISNWAELDPKAAKEWLDTRDEWKNAEYRRAFIRGWYESDRPAVVSYILAHAEEPDARESLGDILRGLYYDSKNEARKFIEALPDDRIRKAAFQAAFENTIYDEVEDGGEPAFAPRSVADWMAKFPPDYWKGRMKDVFKWSRKAPREMVSWVEQQPAAIRDAVAAEYTPPWKSSADDALGAVLQVGDLRLRDQLLEALFKHWYDAPREDMQEAISKAPLSTEQRAHVLQVMTDVNSRPTGDVDEKNDE